MCQDDDYTVFNRANQIMIPEMLQINDKETVTGIFFFLATTVGFHALHNSGTWFIVLVQGVLAYVPICLCLCGCVCCSDSITASAPHR